MAVGSVTRNANDWRRRYSALLLRTVERMLEKVLHGCMEGQHTNTQTHARIHAYTQIAQHMCARSQTVPRRPSVKQMLGERQIQAKAAALKTSL